MSFRALAAAGMVFCSLLLSGCIKTAPQLRPDVTLPPAKTAQPTPEATPTPEPVIEATPAPTLMLSDALGEPVLSAEHFKRYITFKNIQVYEQAEDTFMDCVAENSYPESLVCALDIVFYEKGEDDGEEAEAEAEEVARGKVQTRDAQYLLILTPGENVLFAQINTDMTLTDVDFTLEFDPERTVLPE